MLPRTVTALIVGVVAVTTLTRGVVHTQTPQKTKYLHTGAQLLAEDKPVFFSFIQGDEFASQSDIDIAVFDLEHYAFNVPEMRDTMHRMAYPRGMGTRRTFLARIPAYGREIDKNTWMVKQVLDQGVDGVVFPQIDDVDQAFTAVRAMRYPQAPNTPNYTGGVRGSAGNVAAKFWGIPYYPDYTFAADMYPVGNLMIWIMIESQVGVKNVHDIARQLKAKNITAALWAGEGDLGRAYFGDKQGVAQAVDTILAAGKETGLPVVLNSSANIKQGLAKGGRIFMDKAPSAETRRDAGR